MLSCINSEAFLKSKFSSNRYETSLISARSNLSSSYFISGKFSKLWKQSHRPSHLSKENNSNLPTFMSFSSKLKHFSNNPSSKIVYRRSYPTDSKIPAAEMEAFGPFSVDKNHSDYVAIYDEPHESLPDWALSLRHVLVACLGSLLFGYHMGVVNGPLEYLSKDLGFYGNTFIQGLVVSMFLSGAFFGCAFSSHIADSIGRKRTFQLCSIPIIVGSVMCATASSLHLMILGRFLTGLGLGLSTPVAALYISEISPTAQRGTFGSLCQVATCGGILLALLASLPLSTTAEWWRSCFWIGTFPAVLLLVGMQFSAESPRWLSKKGRRYETEKAIELLWGPKNVKSAMEELGFSETAKEGINKGGAAGRKGGEEGDGYTNPAALEPAWMDLLSPKYIKVTLIGGCMFALQQLSGINAMFYFSSTIFKNAGMHSDMAASAVMGFANLAAALLSTMLVDRLGRKKLLLYSFSGMGLASLLQSFFLSFSPLQFLTPMISVIGTITYVVAFAFGAGPVPALLLPEIFPARIRAKGMAASLCVHWIFNFLVGFMFLPLLNAWGASMLYFFFASICFTAVAFSRYFVIETKGKSLEEIECLLMLDH